MIEKQKFESLYNKWREETCFISSISTIKNHPAANEIISMGTSILPLLLEKLRKEPSVNIFICLQGITGEDSLSQKMQGRIPEMTKAWLKWGKVNGYIKTKSRRIK